MDFDAEIAFVHDGRAFRCTCTGGGVATGAEARVSNARWVVTVDGREHALFECSADDTADSVRTRVIAWWDAAEAPPNA